MRGDTTPESEVAADANVEGAAKSTADGERRPSIVTLQSMLKKVSHGPIQQQYQSSESASNPNCFRKTTLVPSSSDSGGSPGDRQISNSKGVNSLPYPPCDYESSGLDLKPGIRTVTNEAGFSEPQQDLFQALSTSRFQTSTLAQKVSANENSHHATLTPADLFKPVPPQPPSHSKPSQVQSSDLFQGDGVNLFQATKGEDLLQAQRAKEVHLFDESPSTTVDPFKSPSDKEDGRPWSPQPTVANPFYTSTTNQANLFHAVPTKGERPFYNRETHQDSLSKKDIFGMSDKNKMDVFSPSTNSLDPFPSPITKDLFQDVSSLDDLFGTTPSKQYSPFADASDGTPDIFQKLPSKINGKETSGTSINNAAPKPTYLDWLSPDLSQAAASGSQPNSSDSPYDHTATPQEDKEETLPATPFSRARNLSMTPSQALAAQMTHVSTFKRPPKPFPRRRPPMNGNPPSPANLIGPEPTVPKTSPKPVSQDKLQTQEGKSKDPEDAVVLLTGQEKCVEDWPEDSPELNPNFKPSGTLRLRRESLNKKSESDGGSGEDQDSSGSHHKRKDKKIKMSLPATRGSKQRSGDDTKEGRSMTLPVSRKSSKDYFPEAHMISEEKEDMEHNSMDYRKKQLKTKVNQLLRRASTNSMVSEAKYTNGHSPQESKDDDLRKKSSKKNSTIRRWSEGTALDNSTGEDEEDEDSHGFKTKKKVKIRFVPQRGFAITVEKKDDEVKGAHGYTPRKGSKEKSQDDLFGAHGYTPRKKSQEHAFEDLEEMKGQSLQSTSMAGYTDDEHFRNTLSMTAGFNEDEDPDFKPKKTTKMKLMQLARRSSKEDMLEDGSVQRKKSIFSAEELDYEDQKGMEDCKPKTFKHKAPVPIPRKAKTANGQSEPVGFRHDRHQQASDDAFAEDDMSPAGKYSFSSEEMEDSDEDEKETYKSQKKPSKLKGLKKRLAKRKASHVDYEDPPGAASGDYMSEAARAEWLAAQHDEQALEGLEDEDEDGDTDSLMEWWYTVEQWDEVPSDDEDKVLKEDESKSFTILANKVHRGLQVFNKVFTERAESLWQSIISLHTIADNISKFHKKAKMAGITGGTTTAVGGVTAIAGLALAPFTFGASLVITAVGVGVATAGGIASASAAISDNVNNMHDRKKVEVVLEQYEAHLLDIGKILHFVNQGLYKLRGHPFLRSGTQHYSQDWEVRRAVQMISLVDSPVMRGTEVTDASIASVQGLFQGMDKYFIKDSRELKKGCKKEVVAQIKEVANVLNDGVVELNAIREELQDATGSV